MARTLYSFSMKISEFVGAEYAEETIQEQKRKHFKVLDFQNFSQTALISEEKGDDEKIKNVYWRPKEKRYTGIKTINGHRIVVYAKTKAECSKKLNAEIRRVKKIFTASDTVNKNITLKEYWKIWYQENEKGKLSKTTVNDLDMVFSKLKSIHNYSIQKITKDIVKKILQKNLTYRERQKTQVYFKAVMKSAFNDGLTKINPFNNIKLAPPNKKRRPALTFEQQQLIYNELSGSDLFVPFIILVVSGLRLTELDIENIEKNINIDNNLFRAVNRKQRNEKKDSYKVQLLSNELKNFILDNLKILRGFTHRQLQRKFKECMISLGIDASIGTLRHTSATNRFVLGQKEFEISTELGHSSTTITKDYYIDIDYSLSKEKLRSLYGGLYRYFD